MSWTSLSDGTGEVRFIGSGTVTAVSATSDTDFLREYNVGNKVTVDFNTDFLSGRATPGCAAGVTTCLTGLSNTTSTATATLSSGEVVPAPMIGHGLFVLLAVGGVLFGGKSSESLKKRHLHAT